MSGHLLRADGLTVCDNENVDESTPTGPPLRRPSDGTSKKVSPELPRAQALVALPPLKPAREAIELLATRFAKGSDDEAITFTYIARDRRVMRSPASVDDLHKILAGFPARTSRNYPRQKNITGFQWFGKHTSLVPFESVLEQSWLRWVEWTQPSAKVASQPMLVTGTVGGYRLAHTPDFLLRSSDGSYTLINVKPRAIVVQPEVWAQFAALEQCLTDTGIAHEIWSEPDPQADANLKWISRVRDPQTVSQDAVTSAIALFADGDTYGALEERLWQAGHSLFSRPAIDHLLWTRRLAIEMDYPLDVSTILFRPEASSDA